MTDKPILFSAPMVRALLREIEQPGTGKTQTRRVINPQPSPDLIEASFGVGRLSFRPAILFGSKTHKTLRRLHRPGDRLYVREAWRTAAHLDCFAPRSLPVDSPVFFQADAGGEINGATGKFRQGMHMPRWASRITTIVEEVRVQRLQEISEADAIAEGCTLGIDNATSSNAVLQYATLWDSLNADRGYGWDENPWVAAYTFRPILGNIDRIGGAA